MDANPSTPSTQAAADYDLSELDISFDKISRPQDLTTTASQKTPKQADNAAQTPLGEAKEAKSHLSEEQLRLR